MTSETPAQKPKFESRVWRVGNAAMSTLARLGVGPVHLLTTRGRQSGRPSTVPVVPVDEHGKRWLVAPYGPVAWVWNTRAAGRVTMRYGRATHDYLAREVSASEAGPVLKRYVALAPKARSQFAAGTDDPAEAFAAESDRHPVFELTSIAE